VAGNWTDYLVVINDEDYQAAQRLGLVPEDRLRKMPGIGIDLDRYSSLRVAENDIHAFRAALGLGPDAKLFLVVAEFNRGKRHRDTVEALALTNRPDFHVAFAGIGPELEPVRTLAADRGVTNRVHFLGYRSDVPTLLRAATALILPSEREGLPRSIMEAMALGVPVIGADVRGIRDLVARGAGIVVPVADPGRLANAMTLLADDPSAACAMGQCGKLQVQQYGLKEIIPAHESLYSKALNESEDLRMPLST
jgi:glycosyltransferase involved in cell wall biosynthesis